jgi:hypothetical protein
MVDTPAPDPDPLECIQPDAHAGRGTKAAGLAAGFGVAANGTPYHGPYGPGVDLSTLRVAPGVAPEAQLYALKVFGCHGSTALLTQAIELLQRRIQLAMSFVGGLAAATRL